ncbi:MAG: hypothetical protein WC337_10595, partial [Candidatus Muiribacteriota bacterium]
MKGYYKSDGTYFEKTGIENDISVNSIYCAQNFDNILLQKTINKALEHEKFDVLSEITLPFKASIYIKNTKTLYLITDIYGYGDIYYKKSEENIFFSDSYSYLIENTDNKFDIKNVALYLKYGFSGDYKTIYQNVKKLPPGCVLKVTEKKSELIKYHEFDNQIIENPEPEISSLKTMLNQSINNLNLSKNPIIFYSGGIDSSSILVSLAENGFKPEIFSLKFEEEKYNENK